jgi:predicted secreted hydrolase
MDKKTFFKGNFLLILLTALRTHSGSFLYAAWDNSDGVAASLCGMEIKITPAARGLSGGTISLSWHGETPSVRRHSGDLRLLRCSGVT